MTAAIAAPLREAADADPALAGPGRPSGERHARAPRPRAAAQRRVVPRHRRHRSKVGCHGVATKCASRLSRSTTRGPVIPALGIWAHRQASRRPRRGRRARDRTRPAAAAPARDAVARPWRWAARSWSPAPMVARASQPTPIRRAGRNRGHVRALPLATPATQLTAAGGAGPRRPSVGPSTHPSVMADRRRARPLRRPLRRRRPALDRAPPPRPPARGLRTRRRPQLRGAPQPPRPRRRDFDAAGRPTR